MNWKKLGLLGILADEVRTKMFDTKNRRVRVTALLIPLILLFIFDVINLSLLMHRVSEDKRKRRECTEPITVTVSEVKSVKRTISKRRGGKYVSQRHYKYYQYYGIGTYMVDGKEYSFSLPRVENSEEYYEGKEYTLKYNKENAADYYIVGNNVNTDKLMFTLLRLVVYIILFIVFFATGGSSGRAGRREEENYRRVSSAGNGADNDTWDPFNGM